MLHSNHTYTGAFATGFLLREELNQILVKVVIVVTKYLFTVVS